MYTSRSAAEQLVPGVPPIRLRRQVLDNTDNTDRSGHESNAANGKHGGAAHKHGDGSDHDRMSITHSVRPLKRSLRIHPSPVVCKKARWEVIALVRAFTS